MKLTGQNFIGSGRSGKGATTFHAKNPVSGEGLPTAFHEATPDEVDEAVRQAEQAFLVYRAKSNEERAIFLENIAAELMELGETLITRCVEETALPEARLKGELMRTVNQLNLFASVVRDGSWVDARIDHADPDRQPLPKPDVRSMSVPLGPVGVFGASNFPLAFSVAGGDTASALAAGCPVVVKAHPLHPGTSELVGSAIIAAARRSGMPDGVFSLVQGAGIEVGMALVQHPLITAIGFTGSFRGGKALFDAANRRPVPIPVFAEMSSANPVFILPGAIRERAKELSSGLVGSLTLGVGQFCTNPGLVVTKATEESRQLLQAIAESVAKCESGTMLSEGILNNFNEGVERLKDTGGVELLAAGRTGANENAAPSYFFKISGKHFLAHKELEEEVFGPSSLSVEAEDRQELIAIAKKMEGHLTATIHGTEADLEEHKELVAILERKVGRLICNGWPTGVEVCHSMVHGGPFPATTAPQSTSVGTLAIRRFVRPLCYQDFPPNSLPEALKDNNPLGIWRMVDGVIKK